MTGPSRALSQAEFVALMAMLAATIAFSIDAMLPALPAMGAELAPDDPDRAQFVVVAFVLGTGIGTLFAGPLSDAFGRKAVMLGGAAIFCASAAVATVLPTLEGVVAARVAQGIGASGPRVVAMAMTRDLYSGRPMARILSLIMVAFTVVPAIAPLMGAGLIAVAGWRGVFWAFVLFSLLSGAWLALRQPETLPPERRRPLDPAPIWAAAREVAGHPQVRRAIVMQTLIFGTLFSTIVSVQGVYDRTFDRAESFPLWFGGVAAVSAGASFLNAALVERMGMRAMLRGATWGYAALSLALLAAWGALPEGARFPAYLLWQVSSFALAGLCIGNLNTVALTPMGHIAGTAASVVSAAATVLAVGVALPTIWLFDGTPVPTFAVTGAAVLVAAWLSVGLEET